MMDIKFRKLLTLFCLFTSTLIAQEKSSADTLYPTVGKRCPEFVLQNIQYYAKQKATLDDFKGKWLILDFWNRYCSTCVESFPHMNDLKSQFSGKLEVILVAHTGYRLWNDDKPMQGVYRTYREKLNLEIPCAFDSLLFDKFGLGAFPSILILDENGIVRGITSSITEDDLAKLMAGQPTRLATVYTKFQASIDNQLKKKNPFDVDNSVDSAFYFSSIFARWSKSNEVAIVKTLDSAVLSGSYATTCMNLDRLYNIAYWGQTDWSIDDSLYQSVANKPVLEIDNKGLFVENFNFEEGLYNYQIRIPKKIISEVKLRQAIQLDLEKYLGFKVTIEQRIVPCWKLIVTDFSKIKFSRKNEELQTEGGRMGYKFRNVSTSRLLKSIWSHNQLEEQFFDLTGVRKKIDINLDAIMFDLNSVREALKKNGLDLVKGERLMKCIVIRDPKLQSSTN